MITQTSILDFSPPWMKAALLEIGTKELPGNRGPAIQRYIDIANCGEIGQPWCAIFVNAMLHKAGLQGSNSPASRSFVQDPKRFQKLDVPYLGCIVVYWRGSSPADGTGHVGFYRGEYQGFVWTLGGNEGDMVQIEAYMKEAPRWGLLGYYWPVMALNMLTGNICGPIIMPQGIPRHVTDPGKVT